MGMKDEIQNGTEMKNHLQGVHNTISIASINPPTPPLTPLALTLSNKCVNTLGTNKFPNPKLNAAAMTNRSRRVKSEYARTRTPDVVTEAKRKVATPPKTGFGTGRILLK
jgi:hypothetical protein